MRFAGINWLAVLTSAAIFFAIGYAIHMQLVDLEAWDSAKHVDQAQLSTTRMAAGMILPLATAIGLAVLFKWGNVTGVADGIKWALVVALASGLRPCRSVSRAREQICASLPPSISRKSIHRIAYHRHPTWPGACA
jgi:hypothetical protein